MFDVVHKNLFKQHDYQSLMIMLSFFSTTAPGTHCYPSRPCQHEPDDHLGSCHGPCSPTGLHCSARCGAPCTRSTCTASSLCLFGDCTSCGRMTLQTLLIFVHPGHSLFHIQTTGSQIHIFYHLCKSSALHTTNFCEGIILSNLCQNIHISSMTKK